MSRHSKILTLLTRAALYRGSLRAAICRRLFARWRPFWLRYLPCELRLEVSDRPHYGHCMYSAAQLAMRLGYRSISVIEFGVASGAGLIAAEHHAREIEKDTGVTFQIYGFDCGLGLPPPSDYRDIPYKFQTGFYPMDRAALERNLKLSTLVIGDVSETSSTFVDQYQPAPIGCIIYDLDLYSSTMNAFKVFDGDKKHFLPRVWMYFDDICRDRVALYSDLTGERLAISEFNAVSGKRKISPAYYLRGDTNSPPWSESIFIYHDPEHPQYCAFVGGG